MLIAPLAGDRIIALGYKEELVVSSYTSLKSEPAVYIKQALPDGTRAIYLSDITKLNDVPVEYESDSKLLKALGPLKRKFNLPQLGDMVTIRLIETQFKKEKVEFVVTALRLHERSNPSRTLVVKGKDVSVTLDEIIEIDRKVGGEKFDKSKFIRYYSDYLPYNLSGE